MSTALGIISLIVGFVIVLAVAVRHRAYAAPLVLGFAMRAAIAVTDALIYPLPGHEDSLGFDYLAYYWARDGVSGTFAHIRTGAHLYTWFVSFFYAVFERSPLMMQGVNVLFGALVALNVAKLTTIIGGDPKHARQAAWLCALFPSPAYFSSLLLREVAVAYPLSLGAVYLTQWYQTRRVKHMAAAVAALLLSMAFHSGALAVLLAAGIWMVAAWVRSLFSKGFRHLGRNSIALVAGAAAIAFVFASGFGMQKFKHVEGSGVDGLTEAQTNFAKGRAAYLQELHPESETDVVLQAPLRVAYFLFAPFPWMIRAVEDLLGVADSVLFFLLFFRIWKQRTLFAARRDRLLVLAGFASMAVTFAMGVSNYGTALRHRDKMLPLLMGVAFSVPWRPGRTKDVTAPIAAARPRLG